MLQYNFMRGKTTLHDVKVMYCKEQYIKKEATAVKDGELVALRYVLGRPTSAVACSQMVRAWCYS